MSGPCSSISRAVRSRPRAMAVRTPTDYPLRDSFSWIGQQPHWPRSLLAVNDRRAGVFLTRLSANHVDRIKADRRDAPDGTETGQYAPIPF